MQFTSNNRRITAGFVIYNPKSSPYNVPMGLILLRPDLYRTAEGYPRCVHSGFCCKQAQCGVSLLKYGNLPGYRKPMERRTMEDVCPALYEENGDFLCRHAEEFAADLYIGDGCCSTMNSDRQAKLIQLGIIGNDEGGST